MTEIAVAPAVAAERRRQPRTFDGALLLSGATVASGVLAYAYHVLAARILGPEAYGLVAVLWAALFLLVVVLFRPLEQTTSRAFADRLARGQEIRSVLRAMLRIYLVLAAGIAIAGALGWDAVREQLFLGDSFYVAALLLGLAAYGVAYVMRGVCAGSGWFGGYALLLTTDGAIRVAVVLPLLVVASRDLAAAAMVAAAVASVVVPVLVGRRVLRSLVRQREGTPFHVGAAVAFAWPAAVIAIADQVLVNGGPLLVMLGGGENASEVAGLVFAATMLVRVPVFIFQGLATSLLPNLTRLHAAAERALFRRAVLRTVGGLAGVRGADRPHRRRRRSRGAPGGLRARVHVDASRAGAARRRHRLLPRHLDVLAGAPRARLRADRGARLGHLGARLPRRLRGRAGRGALPRRDRVRRRHRRRRAAARARARAAPESAMRAPVNVGVVCDSSGLGATLARTFDALPQARLRWICDRAPRVASVGYGAATAWTTDFGKLLADEDLDAVVFASTELAAEGRALAALAADKHVLVDGPLARRSVEADELVDAAARHKRQLMAHSAALYRPGVTRLHRLLERGALGEIFYVHAYRFDLRRDDSGDLLRELGAETIAVVLDLLRDEPVEAIAVGESYLGARAARRRPRQALLRHGHRRPSAPLVPRGRAGGADRRRGLGSDCGPRRVGSRARALASRQRLGRASVRGARGSSRAARSRFGCRPTTALGQAASAS